MASDTDDGVTPRNAGGGQDVLVYSLVFLCDSCQPLPKGHALSYTLYIFLPDMEEAIGVYRCDGGTQS